jgi:hypothetical protein
MTAISSAVSSVSAPAASAPSRPPVAQKTDSDGDHDNSPAGETSDSKSGRALNVLA